MKIHYFPTSSPLSPPSSPEEAKENISRLLKELEEMFKKSE
ncbi:MAG: hypothetical protein ACTSRA_00815 [Promethearchaeota archaeon]